MVGMCFEVPGPRNIRNGPEDDCLGEKESGREESGGEDPEGSSGPGVYQRKLDRTEKAEKDPVGSEGEALWTPGYGLQEQDRKTQHHGKKPCVHPDSQRAIRKTSNQEVRRVKDGLDVKGQGVQHDKGESDQGDGGYQEAPVFSRGQPSDRACIHEAIVLNPIARHRRIAGKIALVAGAASRSGSSTLSISSRCARVHQPGAPPMEQAPERAVTWHI